MEASRHQCLIYHGSPARHLPALVELVRQKLNERYRCLYFDSPPMVAGLRSYLAAAGIDVASEVRKRSLVLSSQRAHFENGRFHVDRMIQALEEAVQGALSDGYLGLWATGDMTWEFGTEKEIGKLLEYEWKLEEAFRRQPCLSGICQYHADTLPKSALNIGLLAHRSLFINETLSRLNPHYVPRQSYSAEMLQADTEKVTTHLHEDGEE